MPPWRRWPVRCIAKLGYQSFSRGVYPHPFDMRQVP